MADSTGRSSSPARLARIGGVIGAVLALGGISASRSDAAVPGGASHEQESVAPRARASWRDRTREVAGAEGVEVRSDLSRERTAAMLAAETAALRRLVDPWGPPAGPRRLWCFASRRDFEDVLRTEFGVDARGREAVLVEHRGARLVAVCDAAVAEDRLARDLAAAIAERHLLERCPSAPPWLRAALPAWFGEAIAYGRWRPGLVGSSMQESSASAAAEGRLIGADRVIALDGTGWRANDAGGSGSLQRAESAALLATLIGDPSDRSAAAQARRAALGRWWRDVASGREPREAWSDVFGASLAPSILEAIRDTMTRAPSDLEQAIREARWLAEGRLHLEARGETEMDPSELRPRLLELGFSIQEPCVGSTGRCGWAADPRQTPRWSPALHPVDASPDPPGLDRVATWSGAVGPSLLEVIWTRPQDGGWRYAIRIGGT